MASSASCMPVGPSAHAGDLRLSTSASASSSRQPGPAAPPDPAYWHRCMPRSWCPVPMRRPPACLGSSSQSRVHACNSACVVEPLAWPEVGQLLQLSRGGRCTRPGSCWRQSCTLARGHPVQAVAPTACSKGQGSTWSATLSCTWRQGCGATGVRSELRIVLHGKVGCPGRCQPAGAIVADKCQSRKPLQDVIVLTQ